MSSVEAKELETIDQIETVVDGDFHLMENQEDYLPYIEEPWYSMLKRQGRDWEDHQTYYPKLRTFTSLAGKIPEEKRYNTNTEEKVLLGMDEAGVDHILLSGTNMLYINIVHHDDFAAAMAHAWNEWVLDEILDSEKGIHGLIHVAVQKPEKAAEEIDDRADEEEFKGVIISSGGVPQALGHERYFPIYEAAQDNGLPVTLHNAAPTMMHSFPHRHSHLSRFIDPHAVSHPMEHMMHLTTMLTNGVFVRYPNIDFVFQEAGLGWAPYISYRYDNEYSGNREDAPLLEKTPSEYVKEHCYFTTQPAEGVRNPEYIQAMMNALPGRWMFSSDYPHHDFDHSSQLFNAVNSGFDDERVRDLYGGRAREVFNI